MRFPSVRWLKRIGLSFLAVVSALAIAEVVLICLDYGEMVEYAPDDRWGYLMKPSQEVSSYGHPVQINDLGLRGPHVKRHKEPSHLRFLFVGDSVTYGGARIKEHELFCRIVESNLLASGFRAEIVNLSAPGWAPINWLRYIESNGLFDADFVVLVLPECDLARPFVTFAMHSFAESQPALRLAAVAQKCYRILRQRLARSRAAHTSLSLEVRENNIQRNVQAVAALVDLCSREHRPLLTVVLPTHIGPRLRAHWERFEELLPRVLDVRGEFSDTELFLDGVHLNKKGHEVLGARVSDALLTELGERR
jgi:lysophospholipase L1-like esterase